MFAISTYPQLSTHDGYRTTGYIPVSAGDLLIADLSVSVNGYVITGWSEQSSDSGSSNLKIKGTDNTILTHYEVVIPQGVNYVRLSCTTNLLDSYLKISCTISKPNSLNKRVIDNIKSISLLDGYSTILLNDYRRFAKFPNTMPRKACVVFQMDGNPHLYNNVSNYEALLKQYGILTSTYLVVPFTFTDYGAKITELHQNGNEMSVHGEAGQGVADNILQGYLNSFSEHGIIPYGFVAHGTTITPQQVIIARKYFSYIIKNNGDYRSYGDTDYLDSVMSLNDYPYELKRLSMEITYGEATQEEVEERIAESIQHIKHAIDKAIQDTGLLVLYGHSFDEFTLSTYTAPSEVVVPVLQYLKSKIDIGVCVSGNTADIIEYYYTKRYNEQ